MDPIFGIFDADNHYYEPRDAFRHLDPAMADRAVQVVTDASGKDTILVAGRKHHFTPPTFELVPPPGRLQEMMKAHGEGTAATFLAGCGKTPCTACNPMVHAGTGVERCAEPITISRRCSATCRRRHGFRRTIRFVRRAS